MLPWPVCPLAGQARLGQNVVAGSMRIFSPGVAGEHAKKEYVWTPIFIATAPHHGLVGSYRAALVQDKARLLEAQQALFNKSLEEFAALAHQTDILPTDPWYVVAGKARTLRQFGRIAQSVAAYARYADMFSSDPTAKQFSHTACQFTMVIDDLGVTGGLYVYEISPGGVAEKVGILVGDILVSYATKATPEQADLMDALKAVPKGDPVRAEFLRLTEIGTIREVGSHVTWRVPRCRPNAHLTRQARRVHMDQARCGPSSGESLP